MPLSGLRVIDLSRFLPGPQAAALLGDYGAEVIRVEQPRSVAARDRAQGIDGLTGADLARARAADLAGRNKLSLLVDFSTPEGRDEVLTLAVTADVLIHDFRPATIAAAGLDAATVRAANPRLVYVAVSATGATGPRGGAPGHDPVALSLAGVMARTGTDRFLGFPAADVVTAAHTAFAIMVALRHREATGQGATLDAAMTDSALALLTSVFTRLQRSGAEPPMGYALADNAIFATADGQRVVATNLERPFWDRFCAAVGRPDLGPRFDDPDREALLAELRSIYATRTRAGWDAFAAEHDVQIGAVLSPAEALAEPHHHARGALFRMADGTVLPGRPVRIEGLPQPAPRPAPEPGADIGALAHAAAVRAFDAASTDPDTAARASGQPIVGYLANTVPVELIRATGCFALQITGSPADETPLALRHMEPFMDGWALSVFQRALDGRLSHLAALVVPRTSEVHLQLFYHLLEHRRRNADSPAPEPILFDLLQTPFEATARYDATRFVRLRDRLGALGTPLTDESLAAAVTQADAVRAALARVNALRTADRPRLSGAAMHRITLASTRMAPADFIAAADRLASAGLPARSGPRILLTGSPHDTDAFHRLVEAEGATVTGDDHAGGDWWFEARAGDGDPTAALLRLYQLDAPSPRTFPRERGDARLMRAVERSCPDGVIFFTDQWDDTLGFDYPSQRAQLAAHGIPCLFLPEQPYRTPDRGAQRATVRAFLARLTTREAVA